MNENKKATLLHRFLYWEDTKPDTVYFTEPRPDGTVVEFTWKEVGDQARRMAAYLQSLQLPPQSNISILGKNSAHWIIADLAIWMAGHVSVPMYPTLNAITAQYIFEHCNCRLLFVGKLDGKTDGWTEIKDVVPTTLPIIGLPMSPAIQGAPRWEAIVSKVQPLQIVPLPVADDIATIIYTSGSTGKPKGVVHSFGNMMTFASSSVIYGANSGDRFLSYLPLAHVAERALVESTSLFQGASVYFSDSLETFAQDLRRARPTLFLSVPRLWTKFYLGVCAKLPPKKQQLLFALPIASSVTKKKILTQLGLDAVRVAFTGSAPLPAEITNWYREIGLELLDVYGMSENFGYSHMSLPDNVRIGYSGRPLPNAECYIDDNGEILVKSPAQMLGYYKQPELTADSMTPDGYFRTGDRGEVDQLGRLKITGRVKELFKTSKGKYVAPAPIENKLTHPKIEAVCVTGPAHPQPFVLMMLSPEAKKELRDPQSRAILVGELQALLESVNSTLEDHEKLHYIVTVKDIWTIDNGFLTPTLKIKRNVIEDYYLPKAPRWFQLGQTVILEAEYDNTELLSRAH
jgi:long-subunit acyl-CoA synthetase (AMP-forming)